MRFPTRAFALIPLCAFATLAAAPPPFGIERGPVNLATSAPRATPKPSASPAAAASVTPVATQRPSASPAPGRNARGAPAAPPDGTYVYDLSRNETTQGSTTVALFRRSERDAIETNEVGHFGAATENAIASFSYFDFATENYVATYRAPFT